MLTLLLGQIKLILFYENHAHYPIVSIFKSYLDENVVPNGWLTAHIKPLLKKGVFGLQ